MLRKNPGLTFTSLVTLSLTIGANAAIFTLVNALIFAAIPVQQPERLVSVSTINTKQTKGDLSIPAFLQLDRSGIFSSALAWSGGGMTNLEMNGTLYAGSVDQVGGDYYGTLGVRPILGRGLTRTDIGLEHFTPAQVAVIGYGAWQRYYRGDASALGKTIRVNGKPYTIIGVHPRSFPGLIREAAADATIPVTASAASARQLNDRTHSYYTVIGRLREGMSEAQAKARIAAIWPAIRENTAPEAEPEHSEFLARRIQVEPAAHGISYLRARFTQPLYILSGLVALLLLLACANLASMALAQARGRAAELSIRTALGASRWRLARASLVESLLLAAGGAIPGLAFAYWGSEYVAGLMWQGYVPLALSLKPDLRVVLFTLGVGLAAGVVFGVLPAWRAGNHDPAAVIAAANTRVAGGPGFTGRTLVVVQIALSFAVVNGALLLDRSLNHVLRQDLGFQALHLLVAQLFPRTTYQGYDHAAYFRQLLASLRQMPGVEAATLANNRPVGLMPWGVTLEPAGAAAIYRLAAPGYFDTLGMRLLRGRDFDLRDDQDRPRVAIVSAKLARLLAPSGDAVGRRVKIHGFQEEFAIIGVASDATLDDPRARDAPAIYAAGLQRLDYMEGAAAIIRTTGDPAQLSEPLRKRIEALGREYPLRIDTVSQETKGALLPERVLSMLSAFFGAVGLLLACIGLYGLMAYTVSRRNGEIGIRAALGASRARIARMVLGDVCLLLAVGLAAGMALAFVGVKVIAAYLYGLSAHDPSTLAGAAAILILVAIVASLVPALRAVRIDPASALRHE